MAGLNTFVDDFESGTVPNSTNWPVVTSGGYAVVGGGVLSVTTPPGGAYATVQTAATWTVTSSTGFTCWWSPAPVSGGNSQQTYVTLDKDDNNWFGFLHDSGNLYTVVNNAGTLTQTLVGAFNPTSMAWMQFLNNSSTAWTLKYGSNGVNWTSTGITTSWSGTSTMRVTLLTGKSSGDPSAVALFDHFNGGGAAKSGGNDSGGVNSSTGEVARRVQVGADTASAVDSVGTVTGQSSNIFDGDTGSGVDSSGTLAASAAGTEDVTGADNLGAVVQNFAGTDTATGTDTGSVISESLSGSDTATGTDTGSVTVQTKSDLDSATGTDTGSVISESLSGSDTATGTDNIGTVVQKYAGTDTGTGSDSAGGVTVSQTLNGADTVSSAEAFTPSRSGAEIGVGTEAVAGRSAVSTDTGAGVDSAGSVSASTLLGADTAHATDLAALTVVLTAIETALITEAERASFAPSQADTVSAAEVVAHTAVTLADADLAGTEFASILTASLSDEELSAVLEHAARFVVALWSRLAAVDNAPEIVEAYGNVSRMEG